MRLTVCLIASARGLLLNGKSEKRGTFSAVVFLPYCGTSSKGLYCSICLARSTFFASSLRMASASHPFFMREQMSRYLCTSSSSDSVGGAARCGKCSWKRFSSCSSSTSNCDAMAARATCQVGVGIAARKATGCYSMRWDATAWWDAMRQLPCDLRAAYRKEVVRVLLLLRELFLKLLVDVEWDCARVEARGRAEPAASTTTSSTKASARHFVGMRRLRRGCWWDVV
jgi:hypothetical protein